MFSSSHSRSLRRHSALMRSLRPAISLRFFCLAQKDPDGYFQPLSHTFQGRDSCVPLSSFQKAILRAVHTYVVREGLLAPVIRLSVATDAIANAVLK